MAPFDTPVSISAFDAYSGKVILEVNDSMRTYANGEISYNPLQPKHYYSPNQIVPSRSEMVVATEWGIEMVYPSHGSSINRVISFEEIDPQGNYSYDDVQCVISPDAQIIVFRIHKKSYESGLYDLYMVNRDGTELAKIIEEHPITSMAVSLPYELTTDPE
jgi:hypothetical protein